MLDVALIPQVYEANKDRPYFQGMYSFALEQNGNLKEAEIAGRKGVSLCRSDPWSHHAVAHTLYFQCKLVEGIEWMWPLTAEWDKVS